MILTICTDYGDYVVPESVRTRIWDKMTINGRPDRRYKIAPAIVRYFRLIDAGMRRRWENDA